MEIFDITVPLRDGMFVYRGNPEVHLERTASIAGGASSNLSRLELGVHSGTHVDAPLHFFDDGAGAEAIPVDPLLGPAFVVDAQAVVGALDAQALHSLDLPDGGERLLFKTTNSRLWELDHFTRDFVRLSESGALVLIDRGVRAVGIDYLSIGDAEAHRALLGAGIVPIEGLDLRDVSPGPYRLVCLALRIVGSDAAPARALLIRD
jgi:arylformamidase